MGTFFEEKLKPRLDRYADTAFPVLIYGETGVGKDVCARYIHSRSTVKSGPFVAVNCAAIPKDLAESLFFGAEIGAYTGATKKTTGYFAQAQNGTIFLDEIGDLSLDIQTKLLRVVEDRKIPMLGATRHMEVNFRIVAATNRDLRELCKKGLFRVDLYYRLSTLQIQVPPLRERREDIALLTNMFLSSTGKTISPELAKLMKVYNWPGNVRQLKRCLERALVLCEGDLLDVGDLEFDAHFENDEIVTDSNSKMPSYVFPKSLQEVERAHILHMLHFHDWNKFKTARQLDISPSTLHQKIKLFKLNQFRPSTAIKEEEV